jgi:N-acetylmuramoyl-L-alanine amidase
MTSAPKVLGKNEIMRSDIEHTLNTTRCDDKPGKLWLGIPLVLAALLLLQGCASTGRVRVKDTTRTFDTVVVDAGHGGYDDGAKSRWGGREKHHALSVAQKLEPKLRAAGFKTVMTRRSDVFVELNERARVSNRQANAIFVSVHFNHSPNRKIRGAEVYYASGVSRPVAQKILAKVGEVPGCRTRFAKTADFRVLRFNQYPAVLVECGYLSNRGEGATSASSKHHERLAAAIASAVIEQRGLLPSTTVASASTPQASSPETASGSH